MAKLMKDPTPADIATATNAVADLIDKIDGPSRPKLLAELVESGRIASGRLIVTLDRKAVAKWLGVSPGRIDPASLSSEATFTLRRRGVEAKLVLDGAAPAIDQTLLRNTALGSIWFEELKRGMSMQAIASRENLSQRRIARLVDLALLAPDRIMLRFMRRNLPRRSCLGRPERFDPPGRRRLAQKKFRIERRP